MVVNASPPSHPPRGPWNTTAYETQARKRAGASLATTLSATNIAFVGRFGVELEMEGISLDHAREVVAAYLGPDAREQKKGMLDAQGRLWEVKPDCDAVVEVATPPMHSEEDLRQLQGLAIALARAGATVSPNTGVHIHVDTLGLSEKQIVRLLGLVAKHEQALIDALGVHNDRRFYCRDAPREALAKLVGDVPEGRTAMVQAYRGLRGVKCLGVNVEHLLPGRFGTLELRYFNGTLNPCVIGCHVGLAMAMMGFAHAAGPMPTAQDIAQDGDLSGLLSALHLPPEHATSVYLFGNVLCMRSPPAPPVLRAAHPTPRGAELLPFTQFGAPAAVVTGILANMAPLARAQLADDVHKYVSVTKSRRIHARELLALARLPHAMRRDLMQSRATFLRALCEPAKRAEALAWLAACPDTDAEYLRTCFGELPERYMIAVPWAQGQALVALMREFELPLSAEAVSQQVFTTLGHMTPAQARRCLQCWRTRVQHNGPTVAARRISLEFVVACLSGLPEERTDRILAELQRLRVPWSVDRFASASFRALASLASASEHLQLWAACTLKWCPHPWQGRHLMETMVSVPLKALQSQVARLERLAGPQSSYEDIHGMLTAWNIV